MIGDGGLLTEVVVAAARRLRPKAQVTVAFSSSLPEASGLVILVALRREQDSWSRVRRLLVAGAPDPPRIVATDAQAGATLRELDRRRPAGLIDLGDKGAGALGEALHRSFEHPRYVAPRFAAVLRESARVRPELVLNPAEERVLVVLGLDLGDEEAGRRLGLRRRTIEHYRRTLAHKLGVRDAAGLVHAAWKHGYTTLSPEGELIPGSTAVLRGLADEAGRVTGPRLSSLRFP